MSILTKLANKISSGQIADQNNKSIKKFFGGKLITKVPLGLGRPHAEIFELTHPQRREEIFKFRYDISSQEMGWEKEIANHVTKKVQDRYDDSAMILGAYLEGKLIGTYRMNFSNSTDFPHKEFFDFNKYEALHPGQLCWASKLMVDQAYRKSMLFYYFVRSFYRITTSKNIGRSFLGCNSHMVSMFERFGFQAYKPPMLYLDYGESVPMMFVHSEHDHLVKVKSPLIRYDSHDF